MSSRFDMHQPDRLCPVCMHLHPQTNPCQYDVLVKLVHSFRQDMNSLVRANKEAVSVAQEFQKIIQEVEPTVSLLHNLASDMNEFLLGRTDETSVALRARWDSYYRKKAINVAEKLPTETPTNCQ